MNTVREASDAPDRARPKSIAFDWWDRYCNPSSEKTDPSVRARLRRARSRLDVIQIVPAVTLARRLGATDNSVSSWKLNASLDLARVLAHVKANDSQHPMRAAGWKNFPGDRKENEVGVGEERPRLSEARFKRLLETGDGEEKIAAFTRLIALLGGTANVERLAKDFLMWNHPESGDRIRERWAFEYLAAGKAAPPEPSFDTLESEDDGV
ncbi:MAG: type I-E CRISPR-associated protein Cse2/CasB [Gemmatimonadota bacterium]|jgi:CRISPR system Cascade subunit CasB|nr:type I-E CRISPR-associated protein Cse2/CasB [Gemmatimonadota bacterium]